MIAVIDFDGIAIVTSLIACFSPYQMERFFTSNAVAARAEIGAEGGGGVGVAASPAELFCGGDILVVGIIYTIRAPRSRVRKRTRTLITKIPTTRTSAPAQAWRCQSS